MIIISAYEIKDNIENVSFRIVCKEKLYCPHCGAPLIPKDYCKRHRKLAGGEKEWFEIERRACPAGCGIHRILPDFFVPFKHYDIDIITGVLNGKITPDHNTFEDYPCAKTMERWIAWMDLNLDFINGYLKSVGARLLALGMALVYSAANLVKELQEREKQRWLKIIIRAVYNTGASLEPYRDVPG